ncbi:MAG: hypothetical protein N3D10_00670 [Candidatus Micrarchaeota archaeon]|nr:hypothetical protein [Candidatus Micrarchaeota archaeon]
MNRNEFNLEFLSHYPFLAEAKKYVDSLKLELDDSILELGKKRLEEGIASGLKPIVELNEESFKNSILAYAASRLILSNWKNIYIRQRMAIAESKLARHYLSTENFENLKTIAEEFKISFSVEKDLVYIDVVSYLKYAPKDIHYKLLFIPLKEGKVKLTKDQLTRVLEEAIRARLEVLAPVSLASNKIQQIIKELSSSIPKHRIDQIKINSQDFPPCIKKLIAQLSSSINVSHYGRVALAIYLIKAGYSNEQIQKIFSFAPDYNFETTNYQIEFIRKKNYNMFSCATMDSLGLCIADCKCSNPSLFRRKLHLFNAQKSVLAEDEEYVK